MTDGATSGGDHDLNLLAGFVEGRLEPAERDSVAAHLAACHECRAVLAEMGRGMAGSSPGIGRLARLPRSAALAIAAVLVLSAATSLILLRQPLPAPSPAPPKLDRVSPSPANTFPTLPAGDIPVPTDPRPTAPTTRGTPKPDGAGTDARLLVRRGGGLRDVAGKSFHLVAGEWVDSAYDPTAGLPVVVAAGPAERVVLLARVPGLAAYAVLGDRVLVVHDGTVYRLAPATP